MDPITLAIIGAGLTGGGSWLNSSAMDTVNNARSGVINAERGRQQGFDAETGKLNDQSLGRFTNFGDKQTADTLRLADLFKTPIVTPNTQYTGAPLPPTTSALTSREVGTKTGIAQDYLNHQGDTMANLRSFGDTLGEIGRGQAKDAQLIGQIGGFKKGSTGVEQIELDNANRAGNDQKFWGDLASGLGKVALTAGLGGAFAPAAAASGAIPGAVGATSLGGAPLIAAPSFIPPANMFATGASPFLSYGR